MLFKEYLSKHRWDYTTLSKELDVSRITVANWDKGITSPNLKQAAELCKLLDIDVKQLMINYIEMKKGGDDNGKQN